MKIVATRNLTTLLALLCASSIAQAQPVEDPGLAPEAPKPAPKPLPPPQQQPLPVAPPVQTAQPPEVRESTDTQVKWIAGGDESVAAEGDMYERIAAPSLMGPVGLFRTLTGESGRTNTFRIGLHIGGFQQDNFLIAGNGTVKGDSNGRFTGDLIIDYTPWKYIEAYLAIFNSSNSNHRDDPGRTDPEVILSLGDLALGVKGRYDVARWMDLALHMGVRFLNSVSGISFDGSSTNFAIDAIASFDLRHAQATKDVPLRFHANIGYLLDNSLSLLPAGQCGMSTGNDPCIRSRVVETFAYGIGTSRFRISAAIDAPINIKNVVGLQPFVEWHVNASVGDGDKTIANALRSTGIAADRLNNVAQQWLTLGIRVRPVAGLVLDTGIDIGLQSPGFVYGPPVPAWNLTVGAAYSVDPHASQAKTKLVTRTVTKEIIPSAAAGRIRGVVRDAQTRKVLAGVMVKYLNKQETPQITGDDGSFLSYKFGAGPVAIEVSREDYEPKRVDVSAATNHEVPVEVLLTARPPSGGQVRGKVSDPTGNAVPATVRFISASGPVIDADIDAPGSFGAKLPAGDYTVEVSAAGYTTKSRPVTVNSGTVQNLDIVVAKKAAATHVTVGAKELKVKGTVHFGTNNAEIQPDGEQLLDEVVDVMQRNPQIKKVRIEGHTDNRGDPQHNVELSKARAAAVLGYLVKQGIDPARLDSEGYGAAQPLVPNLTPANRARNRRVTFRILEKSGAAPKPQP